MEDKILAIEHAKKENAKSPSTKHAKDYIVIEEQPHELGTLYVVQYRITGRHATTTSMNIIIKNPSEKKSNN